MPGRLCSPQKGAAVKTVPWSELPAGLLGAPSLPCQLSEPSGTRKEAGPSFHPPPFTKPPSDPISHGSTRTIPRLHDGRMLQRQKAPRCPQSTFLSRLSLNPHSPALL